MLSRARQNIIKDPKLASVIAEVELGADAAFFKAAQNTCEFFLSRHSIQPLAHHDHLLLVTVNVKYAGVALARSKCQNPVTFRADRGAGTLDNRNVEDKLGEVFIDTPDGCVIEDLDATTLVLCLRNFLPQSIQVISFGLSARICCLSSVFIGCCCGRRLRILERS